MSWVPSANDRKGKRKVSPSPSPRASPTKKKYTSLSYSTAIEENINEGASLRSLFANSFSTPLEQAESALAASERARSGISNADITALGIIFTPDLPFEPAEEFGDIPRFTYAVPKKKNLWESIVGAPELLLEIAKHLSGPSLLSLYSISKDFKHAIDGIYLNIQRTAQFRALESYNIFKPHLYGSLCRPDPLGRPDPNNPDAIRFGPGVAWLQMILHREKVVRDILACMARQGHRMPPGMSLSLKKMWLLMDLATSKQRVHFMHNHRFFEPLDLYHIQMFIIKLDMRFNDPIDGPGDDILRKIFLSQRGLTPLRHALKRTSFLSLTEIVKMAVRYDYVPKPQHRHLSIWTVPPHEVGIGHLEGWGKGRVHLYRPDELVVREAVRRQLDLKNHIMGMMVWGYVDAVTGENTPATREEKWMSDCEEEERPVGWSDYEKVEGEEEEGKVGDENKGRQRIVPDFPFGGPLSGVRGSASDN